MGRILAIDCGNTLIKATTFDGDRVLAAVGVPHDEVHRLLSVAQEGNVSHAIVAASGRDLEAIVDVVSRHCEVMTLSRDSRLPLAMRYDRHSIGMDRVAAAVGAAAVLPGKRVLVADAGTALTLDVVDSDGTLLGGYIAPGIALMLRSLHEHTALLPALEADGDEPEGDELPLDTAHAMRWGAILAAAAQVDACADRHQCDNVVLTGGNAAIVSRHVKRDHRVDDHLVARGLKTILQHNINN
ncbi:MAG: type III pantothenate kinase [Muribaculaceae bacterium]|nr:type III pantothenate kinase [Muribaculaceae bacterium]